MGNTGTGEKPEQISLLHMVKNGEHVYKISSDVTRDIFDIDPEEYDAIWSAKCGDADRVASKAVHILNTTCGRDMHVIIPNYELHPDSEPVLLPIRSDTEFITAIYGAKPKIVLDALKYTVGKLPKGSASALKVASKIIMIEKVRRRDLLIIGNDRILGWRSISDTDALFGFKNYSVFKQGDRYFSRLVKLIKGYKK